MNKLIFASLLLAVSATTLAQDIMEDGSRIVLPLKTQECGLPSAPPPIPEGAVKEDLIKAQKNIKTFQNEMTIYRACLDEGSDSGELSSGNLQAISNAHNYSVDMEERVAAMFNEALRAYKASLSKD